MKPNIATLALATLVAIASLSQANAQTLASRVTVPFAFECGGVSFAPGTYTVNRLDQDHITLGDNQSSSIVMTNNADGPKNTAPGYLTFRKYGDRYFVAEYHAANSPNSMAVPASGKESRVARDYAMNPTDAGRVQLALNNSGWAR